MPTKIFGVEFAPLNTPLHRRLQTLIVFFVVQIFVFGWVLSSVTLVYLFFTKYYWISLLYIAWFLYDRKTSSEGGRRFEFARRFFTHNFVRDFFPVNLVKTAELDPEKNYIVGFHPHGLISIGAFINFATESTGFSQKFPGLKPFLLTLKLLHFFPLYREYLASFGICDVSKESIHHILQTKGNFLVIVVGGAKEAMDANPHKTRIVLKERKGFVRMAMKHGAHLVPSYSFGENDIYKLVLNNEPGSKIRAIQRGFQKITGITPLIFAGRGFFNYTFGPVPFRAPVTTVVGKPIEVEQDLEPSKEKVDALHERYMRELEELFDQHKKNYGFAHDQRLEIVQ